MKKKVLSLCMAAALVLGSGTAAMAADTLTSNGASASKEVTGKYEKMADPATVYQVDVAWGSMEFTYHAPDTVKEWNPKTHEYMYLQKLDGEWRNEDGANKIVITNYSNKAITAKIVATMETNEITANVTAPEINLLDASIGATTEIAGTASTGEASIDLTGVLTDTTADKTSIGAVTLSLADTVTE